MSGHNRQLGSQRHRAQHSTIWAAAVAVILLALTACASTGAPTSNPTPTASVRRQQPNGHPHRGGFHL